MEDPHKDKRSKKLLGVCKFLLIAYQKFQSYNKTVTNFIQLVSPQPVDLFSQNKLHCKAPNECYPHICEIYKSDNK